MALHSLLNAPVVLGDVTPGTLDAVIGDIGSCATSIFTNVTTIATKLITEPIFVIPLAFFFVGGCIGIVSRLIRK